MREALLRPSARVRKVAADLQVTGRLVEVVHAVLRVDAHRPLEEGTRYGIERGDVASFWAPGPVSVDFSPGL